MRDFLALAKRVTDLETFYKQLSSVAQKRSLSFLPEQSPKSLFATLPGHGLAGSSHGVTRDMVRVEVGAELSSRAERGSLVEGMNSHSTAVDRNGLIPEVQRTMTGFSSSSTDKSSVRHVSPNPRFPAEEDGAGTSSLELKTPQKPAAAYSDSGYGGSSTKDNTHFPSLGPMELPPVKEQVEGAVVENDAQNLEDFREAGETPFEDLWDSQGVSQ
jgi:hypothetical protein